MSEDPNLRPTFKQILSSGFLSPGINTNIIYKHFSNSIIEETNINLETLTPASEWGPAVAHGSTASIYRAKPRLSARYIFILLEYNLSTKECNCN